MIILRMVINLLTCRSFKAKTEHILPKKNSQNKIDGKF